VLNNPLIKDFSFTNIISAFSSFFKGDYLPLPMVSYMADYALGGLAPSVFHITNLLLHITCAVLVYLLAEAVFHKKEISIFSALIFAIHPMHSESVLWIAERKDVLHAVFYVASLLFYAGYLNKPENRRNYYISIFLFLLSLLSKSAAITLPFVLLAIDYYLLERIDKKRLIEKIPFLLLSLIFGIILLFSKFQAPEKFIDKLDISYAWYDRIFFVTYNFAYYLVKFFIPYNLSFFHVYPVKANGFLPVEFYLSPALPALAIFGIVKLKKLKKEAVFAAAFFVITLLLVVKIVPFAGQLVSERYTYIPYIGLSFFFGSLYITAKNSDSGFLTKIKKLLFPLFIITVVIFSAITYSRIEVWKDSLSLYSDVIEKEPASPIGYHGRGYAKIGMLSDFEGALTDFDMAVRKDSAFPEGYNSRGWAKFKTGDLNGAMADYNKALTLDSTLISAYNNRGILRKRLNDFTGSLADYNNASRLAPLNPTSYFNRGILLLNMKDTVKAAEDLINAQKLGHPTAEEVLRSIGK
jgi:tetratricopeptide (TPR) repeat protein